MRRNKRLNKEERLERQCLVKTRYQTRRKALRKKGSASHKKYAKGLAAYRCENCGWWHLGHDNKKAR